MQLLFVLLFLLGLAATAGWVWMVAVGFRRGPLWGIALLLLAPFSIVVYAVKYWDEARKPFLLYAGTSFASLAVALLAIPLMVGQAASQISADFESAMERQGEPIADTLEPDLDFGAAEPTTAPPDDTTGASVAETLAAVLLEDTAVPTPVNDGYDYLSEPAPSGFRSIRINDASRFLGDYVRFVDRDGGEHNGRLKSIDGELVVFERHLAAGTFTFEYRRSEISNLYVAY